MNSQLLTLFRKNFIALRPRTIANPSTQTHNYRQKKKFLKTDFSHFGCTVGVSCRPKQIDEKLGQKPLKALLRKPRKKLATVTPLGVM